MTEEECGLFGELAPQDGPGRDRGLSRYVEAKRDTIVFERFEFDALVGAGHAARAIWAYVEQADLSELGACDAVGSGFAWRRIFYPKTLREHAGRAGIACVEALRLPASLLPSSLARRGMGEGAASQIGGVASREPAV